MAFSYKMEGKVAIVTGSSSGIGEAIALMLARSGACVTICGRNKDRLQRVKEKCEAAIIGKKDQCSNRFLTVQGNLNDERIRYKTIEDTVSQFGKLDFLVANAGEMDIGMMFQEETEAVFDKCYNCLLKSVVFLLQQAVPHLERSAGNVVIVSSQSSRFVFNRQFSYSTAKAALNAFVTTMAFQLGPKGKLFALVKEIKSLIRQNCYEAITEGRFLAHS